MKKMKRILFIVVMFFIMTSCFGQFFWSHTNPNREIKYGLLYNWYAATYSTGGASIAPSGWHVPDQDEVFELLDYLGDDVTAGGKLKEIGTTYWDSPNIGATNEFGFNMRGVGVRFDTDGTFSLLNRHGNMWTTTTFGTSSRSVEFDYNYQNVVRYSAPDNKLGALIRLIKNNSTNTGTVTDYDGNIYPTVKIGDQVWMAQNLAVKHYNDGTPIPEVTGNSSWAALTTGAMCSYNNDWTNVFK